DHRLGERGAAELLVEQHGRGLVEAEPALLLGDGEARDPELGELAPELGRAPRIALPERADAGRRALAGEEVAHRLLERQLVVVEEEAHRGYRGRPSRRSAITLRWISFVPA